MSQRAKYQRASIRPSVQEPALSCRQVTATRSLSPLRGIVGTGSNASFDWGDLSHYGQCGA